ncbi:MAG: response regulator transcription factor [Chitinophagales bacterium]
MNILLVDDHQIVRDGIKSLFLDDDNVNIVYEAENGQQAIEKVNESKDNIDLILMDINMPVIDGIECTEKIKADFPEMKILILSMLNEDEHIKKVLKAGASGYVLKNSGKEELLNAINHVSEGKFYFSEDATKSIMMDLIGQKGRRVESDSTLVPLTDRELEVLEYIVKEFTNQEIAEKLFISVRTVDAHRRNLLEKVGARNTAGLVRYAMEKELFKRKK